MPSQVCSRCQRANPGDAVFCHFDGTPLSNSSGGANGTLPQEFVFPSGLRCRTFDALVQGCYQEWDEARDLLRRGEFMRFLTRGGRVDLARSAQEALTQGDPDLGLVNFLHALPSSHAQQPRLELNPRKLMLGVMRLGETKQVKLTIANSGQGVLQGKITVRDGGQWLKIAGDDEASCSIQTSRDQVVQLRIQTAGLVPQTYSAKLTVITNGGIAEVPVRLDLTAVAFAHGPFKGAATPRQLAEKMRAHPKAAAPLLLNGEVARWFTSNGWAYPVAGQPAPGVAAVQQFFECMGLSKPPPLQLSEREFNFRVAPPEAPHGQVTLRTSAKKWVYAQADSDKPWLRVTTPSAGGPQQASFAFEVDTSQLEVNRVHEGSVQLIANAGQKLSVRVVVDVHKPQKSLALRLLRPLFVVTLLFLLLRVLLVPPADLLARVIVADPGPPPRGSLSRWETPAADENAFLKVFVLSTGWLGGVVGLIAVAQRRGRWSDYVCGLLAGSGAGLAASATLGCLLSAIDIIPRHLLRVLAAALSVDDVSPWIATPLWLLLAVVSWTLLGAALGFLLTLLGPLGARVVDRLGYPVAWLLRLCGLDRLAEVFSASG